MIGAETLFKKKMIIVKTLLKMKKKEKLEFNGCACPGTPKLLFIAIDIRLSSVYKPDPEENESDPKNKSELERNPFAFETEVRVLGFRH